MFRNVVGVKVAVVLVGTPLIPLMPLLSPSYETSCNEKEEEIFCQIKFSNSQDNLFNIYLMFDRKRN